MLHLNKLALSAFFLIALILLWLIYPVSGVPILAYHMINNDEEIYSVSPADFDKQMKYLAQKGYTAISLAELMDAREGKSELPQKPIIISFDDGYDDNLLTAVPIMEKYGLKATVFVISGSVGQPNYLTWEQVRELQARRTEIGSHTSNHVALGELNLQDRQFEVVNSKAVLEEHLGTPVEFLAYPYGSYDAAMPEVLRQAGYRGACTGLPGLNKYIAQGEPTPASNYLLKRVNVPQPKYGLWEFRLRLIRAEVYSKLGI